ncbi:MAG: glycosyltransferase family 2 protein [Methanosphaera sp.]|nr:glycosyltransferase family 2 protein [Methanosphaera sp.]
MSSVAVLIPAYNEEVSIASMIHLSKEYADEVIVIDDGSSDRTKELSRIAGATVLSHDTNNGKGSALRTGFEYAKDYDIIVTIDGDGQHDPAQIPDLLDPILSGNADIVNGSRYIYGHDKNTPKYRRVGQTVLDNATNIASNTKLTDTQSGFRAFSKKTYDYFNFNPSGYGIESDMIVEAANANLRICEVEITVRYDVDSSSDNPVIHGFSVLMRILELMRFNRPLYFFGVGGAILIFLGILISLTISHSLYSTNLSLVAIGYFIIIMGIVVFLSGVLSDTLTHFKNS